ncbi:MAG: DUF1643 domain-containing protein [Flavipsychrobacter sp.]
MKTNEEGIIMDACISKCQQYRYWLSRVWDVEKPLIMYIGLNPSTADAEKDDPTITRMIGFAKGWGYGGMIVTNLFAYRATSPTDMFNAAEPVGIDNDHHIRMQYGKCHTVVFCWGVNGYYKDRNKMVSSFFPHAQCFGTTINGYPKHPLYLKSDTQLVKY